MALAKLSIDLEARLANLQKGFDKAARVAEGNAARMAAAFDKTRAAVATLGGALLAAFSVRAATSWVTDAIDAADAAAKQARQVGMLTEEITALNYAAGLSGVSQEELTTGLVRLSRVAKDADDGIKSAADAFAALGIKIRDNEGRLKSSNQLLGEVAQAYARMPDGIAKTASATELFGRSGAKLISLLNGGKEGLEAFRREAAAAGVVIGGEAAVAAEQFNDNISRLGTSMDGLAQQVAQALLPTLVQLSERLVQNARDAGLARGAFITLYESMFGSLEPLERAQEQAQGLLDEINNLQSLASTLPDQTSAEARGILRQIDERAAQLEALQRTIKQLQGEAQAAPPRPVAAGADARAPGKAPRAPKPPKDAAPPIFGPEIPAPLTDALARIEAADETKLARLRQEMTALVAVAESGANVPPGAFAALAEEITALDPAARDAASAMDALQRAMDDGRAVLQATRTPSEQLATEIDRLNRLLQVGAIDWDTYARATFAAQDQFDAANAAARKAAESTSDVARDLGLTFSSAFEDAIVGGNKLSDVLRGLEQDILRIVTRKLVTEPLGNVATAALKGLMSPGGGAGGGLSGLISSAGSWLSSIFGGFFADGGYLPPGRWGIAGERGPEPIFGGRTGLTVQPAGASTQIVNHFHLSGAADMRTQQQMAARAGESVQRALARNR